MTSVESQKKPHTYRHSNIDIIFDNGNRYKIELIESPLKDKLIAMLKHLQNVKLPFFPYDNTLFHNLEDATKQIVKNSKLLNLGLDTTQLNNQLYLNYLHSLYEKNYHINPEPSWLQFHESIHIIEQFLPSALPIPKSLHFDYREKSGPLVNYYYKPKDLEKLTTKIGAGDCVIEFNELGKTPYDYWLSNEPDNLERFCQLGKPMVRFSFSLRIYFESFDTTHQADSSEFLKWYQKYKNDWCNHWNLDDWSLDQIFGKLKIGHCENWQQIVHELSSGSAPIYLKLSET